jgi:hypothetical protein
MSGNWLGSLRIYLTVIALGNLAWEAAHLPLYTIWKTGTVREIVFAVAHCTGGDLLIALTALSVALVLFGNRNWPDREFGRVAAVAVSLGVAYTIFSEWLNIVIRKSWAYSELMPILKIAQIDVGLSPLLQWVFVPLVALWLARRGGSAGERMPSMK